MEKTSVERGSLFRWRPKHKRHASDVSSITSKKYPTRTQSVILPASGGGGGEHAGAGGGVSRAQCMSPGSSNSLPRGGAVSTSSHPHHHGAYPAPAGGVDEAYSLLDFDIGQKWCYLYWSEQDKGMRYVRMWPRSTIGDSATHVCQY